MRIKTISPKTPFEVVPVTFNFTDVTDTVDTVVSISVIVKSGTDANTAAMPFGSPQIEGGKVKQLIKAGVDQAAYLLRCDVTRGQEKYTHATYMEVIEIS